MNKNVSPAPNSVLVRGSKGIAHIFILIILALVVIGVIGYWAYKSGQIRLIPPQKQADVSPTPDPAANWKTYRNEEYGFEFKYSSNWTIKEYKHTQSFIFIPEVKATEPLNFYYSLDPVFEVTLKHPESNEIDTRGVQQLLTMSVNNAKKDYKKTELKGIQTFKQSMQEYFKEGRIIEDTALANVPAIRSRRNLGTGNDDIEYLAYDGHDEEIDVYYNNLLYSLYYDGKIYKHFFDQILSTFKFLPDDCGECPQYSPPSADFCKDGEIVPGGLDECGCQLPPTCKR